MAEVPIPYDEQQAVPTIIQSHDSHLRIATENTVRALAPIVSTATAVRELDAYGYIDAPWIQDVPGIDHATSFIGSWAIATGITVAVDKVANRLESSGSQKIAERMRRASNIIAWSGSLACQLTIETSKWGGVGDVRDVIAGAIATVPGILHGRALTRHIRPDKKQ